MALGPDDTVCFCFHVTLRKVETFCRTHAPRHASQISECLSAGTGCGWCRPVLQQIHRRMCGQTIPWWRQGEADAAGIDLEALTPELHAAGRVKHIQEGKGKPPPGAD